MSWNNGDNRNPFFKRKLKLGHYYVLLTAPRVFPEKYTLITVERVQLPELKTMIPNNIFSPQLKNYY